MIKYLLVFVLFALISTSYAEESDVIVLDDKNFETEIVKHEFVLVEFYAPWCGHCKQLAPEYEKAATELKGKGAGVLAKFDADANKVTGQKYGIQGFPTLKLFRNGKEFKDYDGGRKADQIVDWMKKKTGPIAKKLNTQEEIDTFVKENKGRAIVGYFNEQNEQHKKFMDTIGTDKVFEDFGRGEVFDLNLVKSVGNGHVQLFREFDKPIIFSKGYEELKTFVVANGYPLVEEIGAQNFQRFVDAGLPLAVGFLDYTKKEDKEASIKILEKVAETLKGKFSFTFSDGIEYKEQLESMGGDGSKLPSLAAMDIEKRINYPYSGEFTETAITAWAKGILDGSIKPFYKSDPIPEKNDEPVFVVVGKSFESEVINSDKDVLLEYYAPWCGHCKTLEPKYNALATFLKDIKSVRLAKIDATTNDTPIQIEGFPTLFFFPKGSKDKPIPFEGARTEKGILKFLKENSVAAKEELSKLNWNSNDKKENKTEEKKEEL